MMTARNCATSLKRRPRTDPMRAYDALPAEVRQWLAGAVLPWSAQSVRKLWMRALRAAKGDRQAARDALARAERQRLERDVPRIWGKAHPFLALPAPAS
jgi:hypothetical protein